MTGLLLGCNAVEVRRHLWCAAVKLFRIRPAMADAVDHAENAAQQ